MNTLNLQGIESVLLLHSQLTDFTSAQPSPTHLAKQLAEFLEDNLDKDILEEFYELLEANKPAKVVTPLPPAFKAPNDNDDFTEIRLEVNSTLSKEQIEKLSQMLDYALTTKIRCPLRASDPTIGVNTKAAGCVIHYGYDSADSPRSAKHHVEAFDFFQEILAMGTPQRVSKNNTRAHEAFDPPVRVIVTVR